MDALTRFIHRTGGEPWVYGVSDCAPWLLRWVVENVGGYAHVPRYRTKIGALRLIRVHGGVLPLYRSFASRLGLVEGLEAKRGDVGIITHDEALTGYTGGICVAQDRWAVKMHDGRVWVVDAHPVIVWRVPCMNSEPRRPPGLAGQSSL